MSIRTRLGILKASRMDRPPQRVQACTSRNFSQGKIVAIENKRRHALLMSQRRKG